MQIQLLHNIQQMLIVILVEKMQGMGLCPLPYLEVVVHLWLLVHSIVAVFAFVCILFSSNSSCRHISQYARETRELICTYCMAGSCQGWFQSELIQHWLSQFANTIIRLFSLQGVPYLYGLHQYEFHQYGFQCYMVFFEETW